MNYVTTWALFKQQKIAAHKINFKNDKIIVWLLQQDNKFSTGSLMAGSMTEIQWKKELVVCICECGTLLSDLSMILCFTLSPQPHTSQPLPAPNVHNVKPI